VRAQFLVADPQEIIIIRRCLADHIRLAPVTTFQVVIDHCLTAPDGQGGEAHGDLMGLVLRFLAEGGYDENWAAPTRGRPASTAWCGRDSEGGKGAVLEMLWVIKNEIADQTLREGMIRVSVLSPPRSHLETNLQTRLCNTRQRKKAA
jgi:hypothetical protein